MLGYNAVVIPVHSVRSCISDTFEWMAVKTEQPHTILVHWVRGIPKKVAVITTQQAGFPPPQKCVNKPISQLIGEWMENRGTFKLPQLNQSRRNQWNYSGQPFLTAKPRRSATQLGIAARRCWYSGSVWALLGHGKCCATGRAFHRKWMNDNNC